MKNKYIDRLNKAMLGELSDIHVIVEDILAGQTLDATSYEKKAGTLERFGLKRLSFLYLAMGLYTSNGARNDLADSIVRQTDAALPNIVQHITSAPTADIVLDMEGANPLFDAVGLSLKEAGFSPTRQKRVFGFDLEYSDTIGGSDTNTHEAQTAVFQQGQPVVAEHATSETVESVQQQNTETDSEIIGSITDNLLQGVQSNRATNTQEIQSDSQATTQEELVFVTPDMEQQTQTQEQGLPSTNMQNSYTHNTLEQVSHAQPSQPALQQAHASMPQQTTFASYMNDQVFVLDAQTQEYVINGRVRLDSNTFVSHIGQLCETIERLLEHNQELANFTANGEEVYFNPDWELKWDETLSSLSGALEDVALFKTSALVHKLRFYISYLIEKNIMFDRHTYTLMQAVLMPVYSFLSANVSGINREEFVHLEVQIDGVFAMFKEAMSQQAISTVLQNGLTAFEEKLDTKLNNIAETVKQSNKVLNQLEQGFSRFTVGYNTHISALVSTIEQSNNSEQIANVEERLANMMYKQRQEMIALFEQLAKIADQRGNQQVGLLSMVKNLFK